MIASKKKQEMCCSILTDFKAGVEWKVGLFKRFYYLFIFRYFNRCACVCTHTHDVCVGGLLHTQKRISDPLGLKLQPVGNHVMWVLGTELASFRKIKNTYNC